MKSIVDHDSRGMVDNGSLCSTSSHQAQGVPLSRVAKRKRNSKPTLYSPLKTRLSTKSATFRPVPPAHSILSH